MSLSDYLLGEVTALSRRPTPAEIEARIQALGPPLEFSETSAEIIRRGREPM